MGAPGCDDAPLVSVPEGQALKRVTFIYPYYDNPLFFNRQIDHWFNYPMWLRQYLSFIVVDDCSPESPALDVLRKNERWRWLDEFSLYRIDVDVRWNWLAARNIGAHKALDGWIMLTDMDHMIPVKTIVSLISGSHDPGIIYRFSRRERGEQPIHPHPNSWFMTRRMYWKVGGYDEALSGHYGTDGEYRRRCAATAPIRIMTDELHRWEHDGDSSTRRYLRKQPEDAGAKQMIKARKKDWKPRVLSFPYREIVL